MFKLALNAGHYLSTPGKRCMKILDPKETREWELNDRICDKIEQKLSDYTGYELLRIDDTTGKIDTALKTRTDKANKWGANFYLSIHHNAGVLGGKGGGVVAYTYTKVDSVTAAWQKELYDAIIAATGLKGNRSKPLAAANLHECRETKMPAVLLECGFMDSTTDVPIILTDAFADKVATACVSVIVKRAGLKKKEQPKPAKDINVPTPVPTIKVGSTVLLKQGAKTYDGKSLASFVFKRNHKVKQIKGDRVVITYLGITVAAVKLADLTLVK